MRLHNVRLEKRDPIAYLMLCRPDVRNAIDGRTVQELHEACEEIGADGNVRAVILSGEGAVFCGGWDPEALAGEDLTRAGQALGPMNNPFGRLNEVPQPVICAINGDATSAGLELALACDIRIAAEGVRFALPEVSLGLIPMGGGTQRLPRIVGRGRAWEMVLLGEPVGARQALEMGLVTQVVPPDRLLESAETLAQKIAERAPLAERFAKETILRGMEMPLEQALRYETDLTVILQTTEDRAEGVRAFLEKRKPEFQGQ